jgi:hypothetical protein
LTNDSGLDFVKLGLFGNEPAIQEAALLFELNIAQRASIWTTHLYPPESMQDLTGKKRRRAMPAFLRTAELLVAYQTL